MNFIDLILTRRSIRKFITDKTVDTETIKTIVKCGMYAPSARNQRMWQFIVVTNKETLNKIAELHPNAGMTKDCSFGILVCADMNLQKSDGFFQQDLGACVQNILLAVHSFKLGAVWTGVYPREDRMNIFKQLFELPANIIPFAFIPVGYPNEEKEFPERFEEEKIHFNIF